MATYSEIRALFSDDELRNRVTTGVVISAEAEISTDPGTADGRAWALKVFSDPNKWGRIAFMAVLAINESATVVNIQGASDAAILSNINDVRASLIAAEAGV